MPVKCSQFTALPQIGVANKEKQICNNRTNFMLFDDDDDDDVDDSDDDDDDDYVNIL